MASGAGASRRFRVLLASRALQATRRLPPQRGGAIEQWPTRMKTAESLHGSVDFASEGKKTFAKKHFDASTWAARQDDPEYSSAFWMSLAGRVKRAATIMLNSTLAHKLVQGVAVDKVHSSLEKIAPVLHLTAQDLYPQVRERMKRPTDGGAEAASSMAVDASKPPDAKAAKPATSKTEGKPALKKLKLGSGEAVASSAKA
jgi:hypothetical protein